MPNLPQAETHYPRARAAQLADVSLEFLERCEVARLVEVRVQPQVGPEQRRRLHASGRASSLEAETVVNGAPSR